MNIDNCAFWNESVMHLYAHIYQLDVYGGKLNAGLLCSFQL